MNCSSTTAIEFLQTLDQWFKTNCELLALFRYSHAAGNKDYEFFTSAYVLLDRIVNLAPYTSVIVWREPQLPFRGIVDSSFITSSLKAIPEGSEYLLVEAERSMYGKQSWFHHRSGVSHAELRDDLENSRGKLVAAGLHPEWLNDSDLLISAVVPDENGMVKPGIY